jgi:hypothetical protein
VDNATQAQVVLDSEKNCRIVTSEAQEESRVVVLSELGPIYSLSMHAVFRHSFSDYLKRCAVML